MGNSNNAEDSDQASPQLAKRVKNGDSSNSDSLDEDGAQVYSEGDEDSQYTGILTARERIQVINDLKQQIVGKTDSEYKLNYNEKTGMIRFDSYQHIYTVVTRQGKIIADHRLRKGEGYQYVKKRRLMYARKDWEGYKLQVLKLLGLELDVSNAVMELAQKELSFDKKVFQESQVKYKLNRICDDNLKSALQSINKEMERRAFKRIEKSKSPLGQFDPKILTRERTIEIAKYIEEQKLEVLSELSNPFKAVREKEDVVFDLQIERCKLDDTLFFQYKIEDPAIYQKALLHYDLLKPDGKSDGLSRDALVIQNNAI